MKKLLAACVLCVLPLTAVQASDEMTAEKKQAICQSVEKTSASIMRLRQENVSYSRLLLIAGDNEIAQALVADAYSASVEKTNFGKEVRIQEFAEAKKQACLQALNK